MSDVIKLAVTKWLESGELCEAVFTEASDLSEFADEWQMILEEDKNSLTEVESVYPMTGHEVPVGIYEVVLKNNCGPTLDALIQLGNVIDCVEFDDLMRQLFFEGFKAGVEYQQKTSSHETQAVQE